MISIRKISLQELEDYSCSAGYEKLENKPISKARVHSYLANPRANKKDIVLFMAFYLEELIGYRTVWADTFFIENKEEKFGWLSGSWVHPKHRRKGVSTFIFKEVLKEWDCRLMYTNYAEASKSLYDKTQQFSFLHQLNGTKFYTRFSLGDILPKKKKIFEFTKSFWQFLDTVLNLFFDLRFSIVKSKKEAAFNIKKNELWTTTISSFLDGFISDNLFQRNEKEFNWIQKYPWILSDEDIKEKSKKYHFSSYAKQFESNFYTVYNKEDKIIGCLLVNVKEGHLKIPYAYFDKEAESEIADFIVNKSIKMKVKTIVVYDKSIANQLNNKLSFIKKKPFVQNYFMTKKIANSFIKAKKVQIQTGDGDIVLT
jgi:GNAT superfamily N-acetyltransferase